MHTPKIIKEKRIFLAYEFGLLFKAIQATLEVIGGILFYAISTNTLTTFIVTFAHGELVETPRDFLSNLLAGGVTLLSGSGRLFIAFYLLSHGIVKFIIVVGLFLKKKWSYPVAVIGFSGLIAYETYLLIIGYSLSMLIFTLIDVVILWLVVREHNVPKRYTEI